MDPIESLQRLLEAVRKQGADIAPTYSEYILLAFAIATDCGEAGRGMFHELCAFSPKYRQRDADRLFDSALRDGRREVHLGTVFHLARQAGVEVEIPAEKIENLHNLHNLHPLPSLTHTRACNKVETGACTDGADPEERITGSDPQLTLPVFPDYSWPEPLARVIAHGKTAAQRDVLCVAAMTALGACMERHVRCYYGGKFQSPCMQLFVVAPPASGKGVLSFVRKMVEPLHRSIRREVEQKVKEYRSAKAAYDTLGKERSRQEPPEQPKERMFLIPGNNTGTGILQNIIDSDGTGLIFETEADTVSTAIGADYGHWSDTLRKAFDHDPLSYNRRTDREYREVGRCYLSVVLSGTPAQVKPLIPSAENGLFSRQIFYYMPAIRRWQSQFDRSERGTEAEFEAEGRKWLKQLEGMKRQGVYDLCLSDAQKADFDLLFSSLFLESAGINGDEMAGSVTRLAVNCCRMLSVVATLRMLETGGLEDGSPYLAPARDIPADNRKDGIVTRWELSVSSGDFQAVLSLIRPLYLHATHILSFLPGQEISRRPNAERASFFSRLPVEFSRQEMLELAQQSGCNAKTADSWLTRLLKKGLVERGEKAGTYRKRLPEE